MAVSITKCYSKLLVLIFTPHFPISHHLLSIFSLYFVLPMSILSHRRVFASGPSARRYQMESLLD